MNLVQSVSAWAAQGGFVVTGTHVQMRERDARQSADIRRIVAERQRRLDNSYAGALVAAFWNAFPWLAAVTLHLLVEPCGNVRAQPTTAAPIAAAPLPMSVSTPHGTFDRFAALAAISKWWAEQDLYQTLCEEGDASDISLQLLRSDVSHLLKQREVHGLAVYRALEKGGRIDRASGEPLYRLKACSQKEAGHA